MCSNYQSTIEKNGGGGSSCLFRFSTAVQVLITVRDHDRLLVVAEEITGTYSEPKTVSYSSTVLQLLGEP